MTKLHEEYLRGSVAELYARLGEKEARGEYAVFISAYGAEKR
jgi:16S rRNA C1402 (ribose-2'-O) methylase RsmI